MLIYPCLWKFCLKVLWGLEVRTESIRGFFTWSWTHDSDFHGIFFMFFSCDVGYAFLFTVNFFNYIFGFNERYFAVCLWCRRCAFIILWVEVFLVLSAIVGVDLDLFDQYLEFTVVNCNQNCKVKNIVCIWQMKLIKRTSCKSDAEQCQFVKIVNQIKNLLMRYIKQQSDYI